MKKKRSEKPTLKRRTDDTNKQTLQPDKHHNAHTPCCDIVRDIVHEIFPQVAVSAATIDTTDDATKVNGGTNDESELLPTVPSKEQPLLGFMIQRYLMEQYHQKNGHAAADSRPTCSAKSKKKKKKKKRSGDKVDSSGAPADSIVEGQDANGGNSTNGTCQNNDLSSSDVVNSSPVQQLAPSIPVVSNTQESTSKPPLDNFDLFLSSIVTDTHSPESSRPNRDIESFASYLARKYEACIKQQGNTPQKSKKSKGNNNNHHVSEADLMKILPTIALDEMKTHSSPIECRLCQTSVHSEMKQLVYSFTRTNNTLPWGINENGDQQAKKGVFVLDDQSIIVNRRQNHTLSVGGFDDDTAFDYISMDNDFDLEAGNPVAGSYSSTFRLEFHPISSQVETNVEFLQIKPVSNDGDTNDRFPLTLDNIINLVKSVILPCGIEMRGAADTENQLSDGEFESIVNYAREQCVEHRKEFYQIQNLRQQMQTKHEESVTTNNRSAIDYNTPQSMNSCDNLCEILLKRVGEFMITITKITCSILHIWTNEYGPYLMNCLHDCWDQFNVTLDKLIHPTMKYRGAVLQMCKRPGEVPQLYRSKMIRDRFLEYLGVKIAMIDKLVFYLEERLINPNLKSYRDHVHQSPSPLARLCVLDAFMYHTYQSQNIVAPNIFPNQDDEGEFKKLLAARVVLAQDVIKSPTKSNIETKERENFAKVKELYGSIAKIVIVKESDYQTSPDHIKQCHDRFVLERQKAERDLKLDPDHYTPELISSLMNTSRLLTMQWIYVLCMRQSFSHVEFTLPSRLDDWMESISGSNIVQAESNKVDSTKCDGSGAKRRVSSVLSSLLYRWLEERCSEWHAELTQNELLTSVDLDGPVANEGGKPSKKKKAKKKSGNKDKEQKACSTENLSSKPPAEESKPELNNSNGSTQKDEVKCNAKLQPSSTIAVDEDIGGLVVESAALNDGSSTERDIAKTTAAAEATANLSPLPVKKCDYQIGKAPDHNKSSNNVSNGKKTATKTTVNKKQAIKSTRSSLDTETNNCDVHTTKADNDIPTKSSKELPPEQMINNSIATNNRSQSARDPVDYRSQLKNELSTQTESTESSRDLTSKNMSQAAPNPNVELATTQKSEVREEPKQPKQRSITKQTSQVSTKSNEASPKKQKQARDIVKESNGLSNKVTKDSRISDSRPVSKQVMESSTTSSTNQAAATKSKQATKQVGHGMTESSTKPIGSDKQPKIGVIDSDGKVISAEDFLVGRMEVLLAEIEEIKSRYTLWF